MARVLMVTAEAAPFAKTGGLGDVLGSLPAALVRLGEEVAVVMPRYGFLSLPGAERIWNEMHLRVGPHFFTVAIDQVMVEGVRYLFVDCPALYHRSEIYGEYPDNPIRFALLNQAALGIARRIFQPDIFHGHDWPAGLLAPYVREAGVPGKCVMTIHNLGYQGNFPGSALKDLGIDPAHYHLEGLEFWGQVSFLKAGIIWADAITTVSPTYAREVQTPEYGYGLDGVLRRRANRLTGILNGVDYAEWNTENDPHLPYHYSAAKLAGKRWTKRALLKEMGLPLNQKRPLMGIVSRFAYQKGFDLLAEVVPQLAQEDLAVIALGSGERRFEDMFRSLALDYPGHFATRIGFDNALAHRIEGGCDMFLMPSRYEPCGLNQMYSLRYGTVPIVRATGGLEDTVDHSTGFKFAEYSAEALLGAIRQAVTAFRDRKRWLARMRAGMDKDYSWDASAAGYQQLYRRL